MEVKGVTLEEEGIVRFPDAPTERGVKHLKELISCVKAGYEAYAVFVVQMKGVRYFEPNDSTHPAFGEALREAAKNGVRVIALDCQVTEDSIEIADFVEVRL
ncbi:MAG: DNA/RNA nuclease SfsA [Papillibacter sp.]|nr:DNA/RNA nuclease SfsA [Papillibacter sp.]